VKQSRISLLILATLLATAAQAFPTKVKLTADPNFLSSEGTQVVVSTNKGQITVGMNHPAYSAFTKVKKGACLNLETDSESYVEFGKKMDWSGISSVYKTRC
jgi:hypothetical protein